MSLEIIKDYAMRHVGLPYLWGGDDPLRGYDCSGFVQELLMASGIDPIGDQTAQGLYEWFYARHVSRGAQLGALAFYGGDRVTHVAWCLSDRLIIEAGGGGSHTKNKEDAANQNAFIRIRPLARRSDLKAVFMPQYNF